MKKKILVVDDETMVLKMISRALGESYDLICTDSAVKALHIIREEIPDLVLADINMPNMSGHELMHEISELHMGEIPIIFLTSDESIETEVKSLELGARDYIHKPFSAEILIKRIERVLANEEAWNSLQHDINLDALTGIYNRAFLEKCVERFVTGEQRSGVFLLMDLDNFKNVNDTLGHEMGDKVLRAFSKMLKANTRAGDVSGRLGGDEFVIFLPNFVAEDIVVERVERISREAARCFHQILGVYHDLLKISVSVGIAFAPKDGTSFAELYQNADQALYYAKRTNKGTYHFYDDNCRNFPYYNLRYKMDGFDELREKIAEKERISGAYSASYTEFREVYQLMLRRNERTSIDAQLIMFTILPKADAEQSEEAYEEAVKAFCLMVNKNLRRGDVTTRYSANQQITLLSDSIIENSDKVAQRIVRIWNELETDFEIKYEIKNFPL